MHIYIKINEELTKKIVINLQNADWAQNTLFGKTVYDLQSNPYLCDMTEDFDVLNANPLLKPFFVKATILSKPKYQCLELGARDRHCGIYVFGKAKAQLIPTEGDKTHWKNYSLKIETSSWEGIPDMKILQERLWAGTIAPTVLYDKEQRKQSIFKILEEILSLHKLSPIKRFFLALRLTKTS
ncbi:MAG: hypothetical protein ACOYMB_04445 [Patescibacteria group bacterium]